MSHRVKLVFRGLTLLTLILLFFTDNSLSGDEQFEIQLKSRKFTPPEDISSAIQSHILPSRHARIHVLMQFHDIPDVSRRGILKSAGVNLLNYIPHKAWFASVPRGIIQAQLRNGNVRWIGPILPEDKIFPPILSRGVAHWAVNVDGSVNLEVSFFKDVSLDEARALMLKMGAVIKEGSTVSKRLTVTIWPGTLVDVANEDIVRWIIEERPPKKRVNDGARDNVGADPVQASPYNLDGAGVDVGIWDAGDVDSTHLDFGARVTIVDSAGVDDHATHVAGTMGGDGTRSEPEGGSPYQWKGMAPQMDIISYLWDNNITDHNGAINTHGIEISQNSWGYDLLGPPAYPEYYGYYGWDAPEYDDIVTNLYGKRISVVFAAGNDRNDVSGDYDTIGPPSTAKNIISVGAINSDGDSMTVYSGWGPMDDGRIKPDVVAPGDEVAGDGGIKSTFPGNTYGVYYGTSMAAPCVSGCTSLIIEDYRDLYSADPLPSTVKALLMHEAKDLGNTGPDYSYGYGDIQIQDAIDKLKTKSLVEDNVGHDQSDTYNLYVPDGTTEVKITLVWDDEPAIEGAASALINDLDLIVSDPNTTRYYPWTLDSGNPSNPAVQTQEDHTNNVEQVVVDGIIASGSWTIEVYGNNVPYAPQSYSLIFTPNYDIIVGKIYKDSGYSQEDKFFDRTDTVYIEAYVLSDGTPVTGATVTADLELSDGTPVTTISLLDVGSGYYRNSWDSTGETPDVYLSDINVADPPLNTQEYFHLYPQSGVSAYRIDYDEDGNDDYILEDKHLIAVYDGKGNTDKSLLYLEQKDTDVKYNFADISDADSIGRGEVTTSNMKDIQFHSFSFLQEGESLASADLEMKVNITQSSEQPAVDPETIQNDDGSAASYWYNILAGSIYASKFTAVQTEFPYKVTSADVQFYDPNGIGNTDYTIHVYADNGGTPGSDLIDPFTETFTSFHGNWHTIDLSSYNIVISSGSFWIGVEFITGTGGSTGGPFPLDDGQADPATQSYRKAPGGSWEAHPDGDEWMIRATVKGYSPDIITSSNITIQMRTEDVDYLVYKLSNFDEYIDDVSDIFSPISGSLGSSVDDDRYHIGNGIDDLISNLSSGTWTNFSSLTDEQKYVAIYDDSNSGDIVNDNVISWIYFPNANTVDFQDVGTWYESGKEALRVRYDTSSASGTNQAEYILAFIQGDYTAINQWMPTIAGGSYPAPNFMTPPFVLGVSVDPNTWPIGIIAEGQTTQSTESNDITVTNTGSINETFSLNITLDGSSWLAGLSAGVDTFVMWVLFCGSTDSPGTSLFKADDIILAGSPSTATENRFGDPSLTDNGVNVGPSDSVDLWFQFQAPTSTGDTSQQSIIVTIGAEQEL